IGTGGDSVEYLGVPVDVEVKSLLGVYLVGFVPLGEQFEIHGRAGVGTMKVEAEAGGFSESGSDEGLLYGVGASFYPTAHHGIRVDYTGSGGDTDGSIWSIAYAFRF
ncbi:MAG TPA: outer membrane beta-barrel protein, partial [Arenibaculum sp.]|nr:outer membrane beta-barrel protein [Arenibaculum sp.]